MNFATMDPSNRLLLIIAIAATLIERTITFWEWIYRQKQERHKQFAATLAKRDPSNRFGHDDCSDCDKTVEGKSSYQISLDRAVAVMRSEP